MQSMDQQQQQQQQHRQRASEMSAITISRQYGSGGGEVAARLARRLGWQLIDHEIVAQVARQLGITEDEARVYDERSQSFIERALNALQVAMPILPPSPMAPGQYELVYKEAVQQVVETAANTGHVVIVGRAGQAILADRRDVLHVRIVAPLPRRISYVARRENLSESEAQARVHLKDRDRVRYIQAHYGCDVNDPDLYDLVINTGVIDLDSAVDLVLLALERKARLLGVSTGELGPAAGLEPYPTRPGDIRPTVE
jgi:cytidylate kinase